MNKLIPEVAEMLRLRKIHEFDADWIARLHPDSQLAAALKCAAPNFTPVDTLVNKSRVGGRKAVGNRSHEA